MRTSAFLLFVFLFALGSCSVLEKNKAAAPATTAPTAEAPLEGQAYDPGNSPVPMTASTPLPTPYGSAPAANQNYQDTFPVAMAPENIQARGQAAPAAYGSVATPSVYGSTVSLAPVLTGNWYNVADDKEVVQFTPTHYKTYYEGEMLLEEDMMYHPVCPGNCSGGASLGIPCFTIQGPASTDCYGIVRLTDEVLELSLLGVSTEIIQYRKLE